MIHPSGLPSRDKFCRLFHCKCLQKVKKIYVAKQPGFDELEGTYFDIGNMKIFRHDIDIYTTKGQLLLKFRKKVLTQSEVEKLNSLRAVTKTNRRYSAAGMPKMNREIVWITSRHGKKYKVPIGGNTVRSSILGFTDNLSNFASNRVVNKDGYKPRCRQTAFTGNNLSKYRNCISVFRRISSLYKKLVPNYWAYQKSKIDEIADEYKIPRTIFTTVTVNKNFRTALHTDSGDLEKSMGNLVVTGHGFEGGETLFPAFGVGVCVEPGDFFLMNVHEMHCNAPIEYIEEDGERLSFVFYLKKKVLNQCAI